MGRRSYWNAVRMVADNIEAGDRSFWNLTKIPDLPTSGLGAINELAKTIIRLTDSKSEIQYSRIRPGDVKHSMADVGKVRGCGFEPRTGVEEGLNRTVRFFKG